MFDVFPLSILFKKEKLRLRFNSDGFICYSKLPYSYSIHDESRVKQQIATYNAIVGQKLVNNRLLGEFR